VLQCVAVCCSVRQCVARAGGLQTARRAKKTAKEAFFLNISIMVVQSARIADFRGNSTPLSSSGGSL